MGYIGMQYRIILVYEHFRFVMCLEAHYIRMVRHEFQHTALV